MPFAPSLLAAADSIDFSMPELASAVKAGESETYRYLKCIEKIGVAVITGYTKTLKLDVVIPETIDELCEQLTGTISLPNAMSISPNAFAGTKIIGIPCRILVALQYDV